MAFWDGLLGGGGDAGLYDELLTEKQRSAINDPFSSRSLAAMAKAFADAAQPSLTPKGGLGSALGNAAYMMSQGRDEAALSLLKAGLTAQQIKDLQATSQGKAVLQQILQRMLAAQTGGAAGGTTPPIVPPAAPTPVPAVPTVRTPSLPPPASPPPPPGSTPGLPPGAMTGLLGGDTQMAGLPPQDELIRPPGSQSILDVIQASYGGGAGMPGLPFRDGADSDAAPILRLASASRDLNNIPGGVPFPTKADPAMPPTSWQESWPQPTGEEAIVGRTPLGGSARGVPEGRQRDPGQPGLPVVDRRAFSAVAALADAGNRGERSLPPELLARMQATGRGGGPVRVQPLGGAAAPAGSGIPALPGMDAPIPGVGMTPAQLSLLDAMAELNKMGNPFKGFLDAYYRTPGYQEQSAAASARGRITEEEPMQRRMKYLDLMIDMRKNGVIYDPQTGTVSTDPTYDALINRREEDKKAIETKYQKEIKTFEEGITIEKERRGIVTAPVLQPDGTYGKETMSGAERDRRLREQSMRPGQVRPGDVVTEPEAKPEAGYTLKRGPGGELAAAPIPGSAAAEKAAQEARAKEIADRALVLGRDVVVRSVDRIRENMDKAILPTTGALGPIVSRFGGTAAGNIADDIKTIEARSSLDAINALRQQGGTLGAITQGEHALLAAAIVNLKQSQTEAQFRENLEIVRQQYIDAVHGPGAYNKYLSANPVQVRPGASSGPARPANEAAYNALPSGTKYIAPDGTTRTKP